MFKLLVKIIVWQYWKKTLTYKSLFILHLYPSVSLIILKNINIKNCLILKYFFVVYDNIIIRINDALFSFFVKLDKWTENEFNELKMNELKWTEMNSVSQTLLWPKLCFFTQPTEVEKSYHLRWCIAVYASPLQCHLLLTWHHLMPDAICC